MSGGDLTHSITKLPPHRRRRQKVLSADSSSTTSPPEAFVDPVAHADLLVALKNLERFEGTTIRVQAIDNAGVPIGKAVEYFGCAWPSRRCRPPTPTAKRPPLVIEWAVGS